MPSKSKSISIIIVTKNEAEGLASIIQSVKPYGNEIIVVDGHSKDNSREIATSLGVRFLLDHGRGRGDGLKVGIKTAKGDILVFFDADGQHEAADIPKLISPIKSGQADLVLASRRKGSSVDEVRSITGIIRSLGADLLTALVNYYFHTHLTDILFSFRAIKTDKVRKLPLVSNDFTIEQELVVCALKHGYKVVEIPGREKKRLWGRSKLKTIIGITFLYRLIKQLYGNS